VAAAECVEQVCAVAGHRGLGRALAATARERQGIRNSSPNDEAVVFRAAGFTGPELVVVPDGRTVVRSTDDLVAETFSLSSMAPHLFGDRLAQFEADLRRLLAEASPDGGFAVRLPDNELKIWRIPAPERSPRDYRTVDNASP
jgi:hypothetical protein